MKKLLVRTLLTGEGQFIRQSGFPRFGRVLLTVAASSGPGLSFEWDSPPDQIPEMLKDAVYRGVRDSFEPGGPFEDYAPEGLLIRVTGGSCHETDSNEGSFAIASAKAFAAALKSQI